MQWLANGRPLKWVTQAEVQQQSLRGGGWCRPEPQFQLVYAFDILMGNERTAESLLFDSGSWFVYVTSHEHAFGTSKGLPADPRARKAILERRDALLALPVAATTAIP